MKAGLVSLGGRLVGAIVRVPTPRPATPTRVFAELRALAHRLGPFGRVALAFPGPVRRGVVLGAPNLAPGAWRGCPLAALAARCLGRPARIANDALVQGLGVIRGRGVELVLTLGTGLGSALFADGRPVPLELGHHPWERGRTYEEALGEKARRRSGTRRWRGRVLRALDLLRRTFQPDLIYVGGGNAARLALRGKAAVRAVSNDHGVLGGAALWQLSHGPLGPRGTARVHGLRRGR